MSRTFKESQDQNLFLTVLYVLSSFDSGLGSFLKKSGGEIFSATPFHYYSSVASPACVSTTVSRPARTDFKPRGGVLNSPLPYPPMPLLPLPFPFGAFPAFARDLLISGVHRLRCRGRSSTAFSAKHSRFTNLLPRTCTIRMSQLRCKTTHCM